MADASQRIHYSAIFRYFEILDHDFFRRIGYSYKKIFQLGFDMPRVKVECSYLGNIEYDDALEAKVSVAKIGNSSYTLSFGLFKENILVSKGSLTNVLINRSTGKPVPIPEFIRTELAAHIESVCQSGHCSYPCEG